MNPEYLVRVVGRALGLMLFLLAALAAPEAHSLTLSVVGPDAEAVAGYRWLLEEDVTHPITPGVSDPQGLSVSFHKSYMPVAAKGTQADSSAIPADPSKRYFISVMPDSGYAMGGARVSPGDTSLTVVLNRQPIPTAQITVFVFEDNYPINNSPDLPQEKGLEGFKVLLSDAAGRYGQAGGQQMMDAFGNPLGTEYDSAGNVTKMGTGIVRTDSKGNAVIRNLAPGKYGVKALAPKGQAWVQTTTIEGSKTIDAWVKANEPPYMVEFGPPGPHVFMGFVRPMADASVLSGSNTINGRVVNLHLSAPPFSSGEIFNPGEPLGHTTPWIGLNELAGGGKGIYARRANSDGTFSIGNVPAGDYQLVVWDDYLDLIIAFSTVRVTGSGTVVELGDVPAFTWFARLEHRVFFDHNQNGFRDCVTAECNDPLVDDIGIPEVPVNLRFRDGSVYQSFPTDLSGFVPFDEIFPFFHWLVAEVDFAMLKATGATVVVDAGGPVAADQGWSHPSWDLLTPQPHKDEAGADLVNPNTGNNLSRTETGPVLLQAFQGFLGQTSVVEWGKGAYGPGENGGISGVVYYSITRAEDDPAYGAPEEWEPGIPRVQVNLYADSDMDRAIDDRDGDSMVTLADIDNHPFGWRDDPALKGDEDIDRNGNGAFDMGDALQVTTTDSWDDSLPANCQGEEFIYQGAPVDCHDGLRNWNQVRPGVFDGGYAFNDVAAGTYIVEAVPPRSALGETYAIVKEEDKNVDFGEEYEPTPMLLPPQCVNYDENGGLGHLVPPELALFPGVPAAYAGKYRPLCDRKQIRAMEGFNAAADFYMFTEVPVAAHIKGMINDDNASESGPSAPLLGEKYAPPYVPVSIRDFTGREIVRTYSDEWGSYNLLVPSTFTTNLASPSGMAPSMLITCINDIGPVPDPSNPGQTIVDPWFNSLYGQVCYTFQFMPGVTTYLDTPVIPIAAFAGSNNNPVDCEFADGTPRVYSLTGPASSGPYVEPGQQVTIVSEGTVQVPNPHYDGTGATARTIARDYGFGGAQGTVSIGSVDLQIDAWSPGSITATVPAGASTADLSITRGDNLRTTIVGLTVTVGPIAGAVTHVSPGGSIQAAIDAAGAGDLIIVRPGTYEEMVLMWKPVRLQGWGAGSTVINAYKRPTEKLQAFRDRLASVVAAGHAHLLPSQAPDPASTLPLLPTEEGAAVLVIGKDAPLSSGGFGPDPRARIDGFTITGGDVGGGVMVNGYASYLQVSNNRIAGNQSVYGGGVRSGHPALTLDAPSGRIYQDSFNDYLSVSRNHVSQNGARSGAGGGISVHTGSDNYDISHNYICGNLTLGEGGGIGHMGLSSGGLISNNAIVFNQSFNQGKTVSGGGVLVSGGAPLNAGDLSPGSGSVKVISNLIQGNNAESGDGGGIRMNYVNGQDVLASPNTPSAWHSVAMLNNIIVDNVAALAGGGISLQDTARSFIIHNTIARNDSTATAAEAFGAGSYSLSEPQPAGIVARAHSNRLAGAFGTYAMVSKFKEFSNPSLVDNIIFQNRSFYFTVDASQSPTFYGLVPDIGSGQAPVFWDLWVLGTATQRYLDPRYSVLTDTTGYHSSNRSSDPKLVSPYYNGARNQVDPSVPTSMETAPAFDEGGNFIDVKYGPLTLMGDYHLGSGSSAVNRGLNNPLASFPELALDYDGEPRPNGLRVDIGADERH